MRIEAWQSARESLEIEARAIQDLMGYVNRDAFEKAVYALAHCDRIMTSASGSSGVAAKKFAHSLCCIERGAMFMPPCEAIHGGLGGLKKGDVLVLLSRGGKTLELMPMVEVCLKKHATLIAVTERMDSPLAERADITLQMKIERESDPIGLMATASHVAMIALFDALLAALIVETGYTKARFGLIHPGGAVGELINGKGIEGV